MMEVIRNAGVDELLAMCVAVVLAPPAMCMSIRTGWQSSRR